MRSFPKDLTAENIVNRTGKTGYLEGRKQGLLFGPEFGAEAPVIRIVENMDARRMSGGEFKEASHPPMKNSAGRVRGTWLENILLPNPHLAL